MNGCTPLRRAIVQSYKNEVDKDRASYERFKSAHEGT